MRTLLRIFFTAEGINPWAVLGCLLLAGLFEGIGFASAVPLLSLATETTPDEESAVVQATRQALTLLGLPMTIGPLIGLMVTALVTRSCLRFLAMRYTGNATVEYRTMQMVRVVRNVFGVRWGFLVRHPIGLFSNAVKQAMRTSEAFRLSATLLAQSVQTVVYLCVAFFVSWPLALCAVVIGGIPMLLMNPLVRVARKAGVRETQRTREFAVLMIDALNSAKPLRAMAKERAFLDSMEGKVASLRKALRRLVVSREALKDGKDILLALVFGGGFFLLITVWGVPVVELVVVGFLCRKTANSMSKIQDTFQRAVIVEAPYLELSELMAQTEEAREERPSGHAPTLERGCRLEGVSFGHEGHTVLHSVSLDVPAGCLTALTGPSGAGKTTIADLLVGLYPPDAGDVLVDGMPLPTLDLERWRHSVGYVPQELILFHDTVFANVALGDPDVGEMEVRRALEAAEAWDFVESLSDGLMTVLGQHGGTLSGGQRQRIALARALVSNPRLLILDEVTSAVDAKTEREICRNIQRLIGTMTILAITHKRALLEIADQIYHVEDGVAKDMRALNAMAEGASR